MLGIVAVKQLLVLLELDLWIRINNELLKIKQIDFKTLYSFNKLEPEIKASWRRNVNQ